MFPAMNPREMQKAMKRLGMRQEEIDAELVIIKMHDKDLVIKNPQVSKLNMMGQETIQVIGDITEVGKSEKLDISEEDISTVMAQTNCTKAQAAQALDESDGNLAEAILKLQNE